MAAASKPAFLPGHARPKRVGLDSPGGIPPQRRAQPSSALRAMARNRSTALIDFIVTARARRVSTFTLEKPCFWPSGGEVAVCVLGREAALRHGLRRLRRRRRGLGLGRPASGGLRRRCRVRAGGQRPSTTTSRRPGAAHAGPSPCRVSSIAIASAFSLGSVPADNVWAESPWDGVVIARPMCEPAVPEAAHGVPAGGQADAANERE